MILRRPLKPSKAKGFKQNRCASMPSPKRNLLFSPTPMACHWSFMKNNMQAFYNGILFDGTSLRSHKAVLADEGRILAIVAEADIPSHAEKTDLKGNYLAPAFIDLQLYGGNGKLFSH